MLLRDSQEETVILNANNYHIQNKSVYIKFLIQIQKLSVHFLKNSLCNLNMYVIYIYVNMKKLSSGVILWSK